MYREKMIMEKNIFEINEITCIAYGKKNPQYLLLQPVNEPHSQMLDQQIRFMTEHTEKKFSAGFVSGKRLESGSVTLVCSGGI